MHPAPLHSNEYVKPDPPDKHSGPRKQCVKYKCMLMSRELHHHCFRIPRCFCFDFFSLMFCAACKFWSNKVTHLNLYIDMTGFCFVLVINLGEISLRLSRGYLLTRSYLNHLDTQKICYWKQTKQLVFNLMSVTDVGGDIPNYFSQR